MRNPFRRNLPAIEDSSVYQKLKEGLYFPYYLNGSKIESLYAQLWGDLRTYSRSHSSELAAEIGFEGRSSNLVSFLAELAANVRVGGTRQWSYGTHYNVTDLLKLMTLRQFLTSQHRVHDLSALSEEERKRPHLFIEYSGPYMAEVESSDVGVGLSEQQIGEIDRRKKFEESLEEETHLILALPLDPKAVSLLSRRFLSQHGHRYLAHRDNDAKTSFFGATIGESHGLLFLDPVAIGYRRGETDA